MQETVTTRRFGPGQIKKAALVLGILASIAIGVTTAAIVRDASGTDTDRAVHTTTAFVRSREVFDYKFREQNIDLPTGTARPAVNPHSNYLFIEQNLYLPASDVAPDGRVIEENSWGENFALDTSSGGSLYPSLNDIP